jgi:hypothetical protein
MQPTQRPLHSPWLRALLLATAASAAGCHGCKDNHPYVPYVIGSADAATADAAPSGQAAAIGPSGRDAAVTMSGEPAVLAPAATSSWAISGLVLEAPPGLVFVAALVRDFDDGGAPDAFAVVRPVEGGDPGQVAFYRGPGAEAGPTPTSLAARAVFAPPADLIQGPGCAPLARLAAIGRRSVLVELGSRCPPRVSSAPDRWVAVVAGGAAPRVRLAVTAVDPAGAPALSVDGEASDRDGDGLDDVALRVTLEPPDSVLSGHGSGADGGAARADAPRLTATLAWLDRPAGPSRDLAATEASFLSVATLASSRAKSPKEAPSVPALVAQGRALWRAVCADGGAPRLTGVAGTGAITCGSTRALEEAGLAEARSYVTTGDALRAALALDRAERAPASRTPSRVAEARKWLEQLAPAVQAKSMRWLSATPEVRTGHEPAWGALAFDAAGRLLVRTRTGVVRVDPDAADASTSEVPAADVAPWSTAVASVDGALRWIEAYDACDGVALHATFAAGDDLRDVSLPLPPPLGDRCVGSRGAPVRALAVAWGPRGLEAIADGEPVLVTPESGEASMLAGFLDSPATRGAPRSPDGRVLVVATSAGLVVRGPGRTRLLRTSEVDAAWADDRDCAVSNDASHVACVRGSKAWLGAWETDDSRPR